MDKITVKYVPTELTEGKKNIVANSYACTNLSEGGITINSECQCEEECGGACEATCLSSCQTCQGCQDKCEDNCQYACENYCQTNCESCETECMGTCLSACQTCENQCQSNCEISCETTCLRACQSCQDTCEVSCQSACETSSQSTPVETNIANRGVASNSISVRAWYQGSVGAKYCLFYCDGNWFATVETTSNTNWTTPDVTKTELSPNTSYSFYAVFKDSSYNVLGETQRIYISTASMPPSTPTNLRITNKSRNSLSIAWNASSNATTYNLFLNGSYHGVTSGTAYTFNDLKPSTLYVLEVVAYNSSTGLYSERATITATTLSARPSNWSWSYNIYSGGSVYNTIKSGNMFIAYIMPAAEWNNFTSRINEFREYKGLSSYSFTTVYAEGNCTSSIINQAVNAINAMGFSISTVSNGNVPASVFIQMKDKLNSIP